MMCNVCRTERGSLKPHPSFAQGPLSALLVCRVCEPRLLGEWPLSEDGKHQWCRACASEAENTSELKRDVGLRKSEHSTLKAEGELDGGAALYTCDVCPCAFCSVCILRLFSLDALLEAKSAGHWDCPVCTARPLA